MRILLVTMLVMLACGAAWGEPVPASTPGVFIVVSGKTMHVGQFQDRAIVDWASFNVGADERVVFAQPTAASAILNRVLGGDPSVILGRIQANGRVFLINPNGILFGREAVVDVGGLVASTLSVTRPEDFLAGRDTLDLRGGTGAVIQNGRINASEVLLAAPVVSNEGVISARGGRVTMVAGSAVRLADGGAVTLMPTAAPADVRIPDGWVSDYLVAAVRMASAGDVLTGADGTVTLVAAEGVLMQGGTVTVDGPVARPAGSITLRSTQVTFASDDSVMSARGVAAPGGLIDLGSQGATILEVGEQRTVHGVVDGTLVTTPEGVVIGDLDAPPGAPPEAEGQESHDGHDGHGEQEKEGAEGLEASEVEASELVSSVEIAPASRAEAAPVVEDVAPPDAAATVVSVESNKVVLATEKPAGPPVRLVQRRITGTQMTRTEDKRSLMRRLYGATRTRR